MPDTRGSLDTVVRDGKPRPKGWIVHVLHTALAPPEDTGVERSDVVHADDGAGLALWAASIRA